MSDFSIDNQGGGRFQFNGNMTFLTAGKILRESEEMFEDFSRIEVDLSGVTKSDSAGLALLLEWITWANHTVREIRFVGVPAKIDAIARTTEVDHLLKRGERWAGFIDAPSSK